MRKAKKDNKFLPYLIGLVLGFIAMLLVCALSALLLSFTDAASKAAGAAAVIALIIGSFVCGRTAGIIRRRDGLKTGALCGFMFTCPTLLLTLIFGGGFTVILPVKLLLCIAFGTVGGISGVNREEKP